MRHFLLCLGLALSPLATQAGEIDSAAALHALAQPGAVLIDVGPAPAKPADLPADRLWLPTHRSIPGAAWMPGAGLGDDLPPERAALLLAQVADLTGEDKADFSKRTYSGG